MRFDSARQAICQCQTRHNNNQHKRSRRSEPDPCCEQRETRDASQDNGAPIDRGDNPQRGDTHSGLRDGASPIRGAVPFGSRLPSHSTAIAAARRFALPKLGRAHGRRARRPGRAALVGVVEAAREGLTKRAEPQFTPNRNALTVTRKFEFRRPC
jgi:hypothetical protein